MPTAANVPHLPELEARAGSRAVSLRLAWLPPEATALAQAVAVLGDDADLRQAAELAGVDEESASEALVFPATQYVEGGKSMTLRVRWTRLSDASYEAWSEMQRNDAWTTMFKMTMKRPS